jgi:hypothetical protein
MVSLGIEFISIVSIAMIFAASIVTLTEFGNLGIAKGQGNITSLTPQQKTAICNPNNPKLKFVNETESRICGIPPTSTNTTSANTTTGVATAAVR